MLRSSHVEKQRVRTSQGAIIVLGSKDRWCAFRETSGKQYTKAAPTERLANGVARELKPVSEMHPIEPRAGLVSHYIMP